MTSTQPSLTPGIYRHYKGQEYQVYELARHSETEEWLVVYRCLYGDYSLWIRPFDMFTENITNVDGNSEPRFAWARSASNQEGKPNATL